MGWADFKERISRVSISDMYGSPGETFSFLIYIRMETETRQLEKKS